MGNVPIEKPILFSAPMVRAILDGRKTQTRRIVKSLWHFTTHLDHETLTRDIRCPYGRPGERLWVRETFCPIYGQSPPDRIIHPDYSRPLFVEWLCTICHGKEHRKT